MGDGDSSRQPYLRAALFLIGGVILVLGILLGVAWWVNEPIDQCPAHPTLQFAGSVAEAGRGMRSHCTGVMLSDVRASLFRDSFLGLAYAAILTFAIWTFWRGWRGRRQSAVAKAARWAPIAAMAIDWTENLVMREGLKQGVTSVTYQTDNWALAVLPFAWAKWLLLGFAFLVAVASAWAFLSPGANEDGENLSAPFHPAGLGVCCSGGGIRAAGFTLGALESLERDDRLMERAAWISGVSGGAYAAIAWSLFRRRTLDPPAAASIVSHLTGAIDTQERSVLSTDDSTPAPVARGGRRGRHRYLANGPGGLPRAVVYALGAAAFNLVIVATALVTVSWPLGKLLGSWFVIRPGSSVPPPTMEITPRLWMPGAIWIAVAFLLVGLAIVRWPQLTRPAAALAAFGVALEVLLVALPWLLVELPAVQAAGWGALTVAGVSVAAVARQAWSLIRKPLTSAAPRLGGALLAILLGVAGGKVAVEAAFGDGWLALPRTWIAAAVGLGIVFVFVDVQRISIRELYRSRLQRSFVVTQSDGALTPIPTDEQLKWEDLSAQTPRLLVCCAAQRIGLSGNGLPAETFTISPAAVSYGSTVVPTAEYLAQLPHSLRSTMFFPSSWTAVTGAAFSSAMGRHSLGTTNALMAAVNADLGVWLPNPVKVAEGFNGFHRVRLGYLVKEVFGLYDENDDYVFVADGGQWENLGLVELLRRRCNPILCIDASGDPPGSFATLREAVDLASTELDFEVTIELSALDAEGVDDRMVVALPFRSRPEPRRPWLIGTIYFAKLRITKDLPRDIRRFALADGNFPHYSTLNQLLDDQQFSYLVAAGRFAGTQLAERVRS